MKKILLVTRPLSPPWDEASKNFAFYLAKNLDSGLEAHLMTREIMPELPKNVFQYPIYTTSEIAEFNWQQKLRSLYFQFANKRKFDVYHYFFTPTKLNTFIIKNFLKTPHGKTVQTVAALREDLWSDKDIKKIIFADMIITYSDYAKNKLQSLGFENVIRIYPGIDVELFCPQPKNFLTMETFDIKQSDFVITYPGEYVRLGATDDLVATLPRLFKEIPSAKFVFACRIKNEKDAIKKDAIVEILREAGILDKVAFTDTFANMPQIFNMSDVIVFPVQNMKGKFDVPLSVIEAFACEKPVIISNLTILQEFSSKENSIVVKTGSSKRLIDSIVDLYNDMEKREVIGKAARKYACENFDIKDVAKRYEEAYTKLSS